MVLNGIYSIYEMTLAGMGIAILPDFLAEDDIRTGRLMLASESITVPARPVCLAWPRHKANLARVRALREFLEEFLSGDRSSANAQPSRTPQQAPLTLGPGP